MHFKINYVNYLESWRLKNFFINRQSILIYLNGDKEQHKTKQKPDKPDADRQMKAQHKIQYSFEKYFYKIVVLDVSKVKSFKRSQQENAILYNSIWDWPSVCVEIGIHLTFFYDKYFTHLSLNAWEV